jgi:hypothetical protein
MSKIEESVEVEVALGTAYRQWTRFTEFPRFMSGVERIDRVSDTLTHWVASVDGVHREFDAEITEQVPDERIAANRTKVMLQLDHEPHGLVDTVGDRLGFVSHQVLRDLAEFKRFIEDPAETPAPDPAAAR